MPITTRATLAFLSINGDPLTAYEGVVYRPYAGTDDTDWLVTDGELFCRRYLP